MPACLPAERLFDCIEALRICDRGWPNRRIHALKAKALLSGSDCGRRFGSRFHHQLPETQPLSVGFFSARNASVGAVSGMVLVSASPPNGPAPTHFRPLCLSFFSSGLVSVLGPTFNIGAGLHAVGCRWQLLAQSGTRVEETQAIAQDDRRSRCVPAASSADGMPRYTRYLRTIGASVPMSHRLGAT